jgi:hypothetical protein
MYQIVDSFIVLEFIQQNFAELSKFDAGSL